MKTIEETKVLQLITVNPMQDVSEPPFSQEEEEEEKKNDQIGISFYP